MSRYVVNHCGLSFAYGYDRPLSEYFLTVSGSGRKITDFAAANNIALTSISCDYTEDGEPILDTDDEVFIHLVGCLSEDDNGTASNFVSAMCNYGLNNVVPPDHIWRATCDLPF